MAGLSDDFRDGRKAAYSGGNENDESRVKMIKSLKMVKAMTVKGSKHAAMQQLLWRVFGTRCRARVPDPHCYRYLPLRYFI